MLEKRLSGCLYVKCLEEGLAQDNHVTTLAITITIKMQKGILNWYRWIKILDYFSIKVISPSELVYLMKIIAVVGRTYKHFSFTQKKTKEVFYFFQDVGKDANSQGSMSVISETKDGIKS